jgi:hypothetical protein
MALPIPTVIRNATIVTGDVGRTIHHDGALAIDGDRIVSAFVHNGQAGDVESVMVDGRWLLRDGRALTIDEGDVVIRAQEIGHRVWRQLIERYPDVPFPIRLP